MALFRTFLIIISSLLCFTLSGCGWLVGKDGLIQDNRHNYREAAVMAPLQLPKGADNNTIRELYSIPGADQSLVFDDEFEVPHPSIDNAIVITESNIYKSDNKYWISLNGMPNEIWARVRHFWEINEIELALESPSYGLLETVWLKRKNDEGRLTHDKFQVVVEYGLQKNISEIHVRHLNYNGQPLELAAVELDWDHSSSNDDLSVGIAQEILLFLEETEADIHTASLLAQKFIGKLKSSLQINASNELTINLDLDYGRAWNAVAKAIDATGFELIDRDRDNGLYYIEVATGVDEIENEGFFSFLSFLTDNEKTFYKLTIKLIPSVYKKTKRVEVLISEYDSGLTERLREKILKRIKTKLV